MNRIHDLVGQIYGADSAENITARIQSLIANHAPVAPTHPSNAFFDQTDAVLITYGDMVQAHGEPPLQTLHTFLDRHLAGVVKGVHILPFYPWSSDDGFSVIDYRAIDPALGTWQDVEALGSSFRLMFDAVINHISQHSDWFTRFKQGEAPYTDYFTVVDPAEDLSAVFRPRTLPLLTPVGTVNGEKHVWTTFSPDQIDLNYASPDLLLDVLSILLDYTQHGAELIRLDAIGFMWKEIGTRCLHLPQTHAIIQLMREVLNQTAPQTVLVTETNVPHHENISYFGDGHNEAQMVYNFSLPPLTLNAFHSGDATKLTTWMKSLEQPSSSTTFFNFCASHDGIGVTPARGILADGEIEAMAKRVEALGGFVSYKNNPDGSQSAYELNINFMDALGVPEQDEDETLVASRFLCSQAIMLALRGVPGIYFHSLFGSRSWRDGVVQTGRNRSINREKLQVDQLDLALQTGMRRLVFEGFERMLAVRSAEIAFHPQGEQQIYDMHPAIVAIERRYAGDSLLCLHNVRDQPIQVSCANFEQRTDLLTGKNYRSADSLALKPHGYLWLKSG